MKFGVAKVQDPPSSRAVGVMVGSSYVVLPRTGHMNLPAQIPLG